MNKGFLYQQIVAFLGLLVYKFYGEELREMFGYEEHPYGFYTLAGTTIFVFYRFMDIIAQSLCLESIRIIFVLNHWNMMSISCCSFSHCLGRTALRVLHRHNMWSTD